jgi:hypothetical protein
MRKIMYVVVLLLCGSIGVAQSNQDGLRFSRVTIKGQVLDAEPKWHVKVYEDASYRFVYRHYGNAEYVPGFFARDLSRNRWLQLKELSTEHARLGRSPDFSDIPLAVGWDFRGLASAEYAQLPLKTGGSIEFPDRVTFDPSTELYRLDCNSQLNRDVSLTSFWVRKADLDALH